MSHAMPWLHWRARVSRSSRTGESGHKPDTQLHRLLHTYSALQSASTGTSADRKWHLIEQCVSSAFKPGKTTLQRPPLKVLTFERSLTAAHIAQHSPPGCLVPPRSRHASSVLHSCSAIKQLHTSTCCEFTVLLHGILSSATMCNAQ